MKGKWKVSSNPIGDKTMYIVCRIKNTSEVEHSGNREYYGDYIENRFEAALVAGKLNKESMED